MDDTFEIAVIGAGPAGSTAALYAASAGRRVVLLERKGTVGFPVRCGEAIGLKGFSTSGIALDERWVLARITKSRLIAPDGTVVEYSRGAQSIVVNRELMDADLAQRAVSAGAHLMVNTPVMEIKRTGSGMYECISTRGAVYAQCVIIADGIESRCARFLGWNGAVALSDIDCCAFGKISDPGIDQDTCSFYFGNAITAAGYAWVFPRGAMQANVGVGILGSFTQPGKPLAQLRKFVREHFPSASLTDVHCGAAPAGRWVQPLVRDGALLVGDAAQQIGSLTGAGINYALHAGRKAGTCAAQAFHRGALDHTKLKAYERDWASKLGKQQKRSYLLKEFVVKRADDAFLNAVARSLGGGAGNLSMTKVILHAFSKDPRMWIKAFLFTR